MLDEEITIKTYTLYIRKTHFATRYFNFYNAAGYLMAQGKQEMNDNDYVVGFLHQLYVYFMFWRVQTTNNEHEIRLASKK